MLLVMISLCAIDMQMSSGLKRSRLFDMNDHPDLDISFNHHNVMYNDGNDGTVRKEQI